MLVTIAAVPPKLILVVLIIGDSLACLALGLGDARHCRVHLLLPWLSSLDKLSLVRRVTALPIVPIRR